MRSLLQPDEPGRHANFAEAHSNLGNALTAQGKLDEAVESFHRIRHYGFLANGSRGDSLALCRRLLEARATSAVHEPADNHIQGDRPFTAADFAICPDCGGTMRRIAAVPRSCNAAPFSCDTS